MKVQIIRTYEARDIEFIEDALEVELVVDGTSVMTGDDYHDTIDAKIDGFLVALEHLNIRYDVKTIYQNERTDE
jgi:hypothetical protein